VNATDYEPQKALLVEHPPTGDAWIHELKLDGFRIGVFLGGRSVRLMSRRGTDYTNEYPEVVDAARKLTAKSAVLDGEVVVLDERGVSNFQLLQQLGASRRGLTYFAFDLLALNGKDLTKLPLEERKRMLKKLVGARAGVIRYTEHFDTKGADVFAKACALGAEGIISKRRDAPYRVGARSSDWQKIKCMKRQEFVVGGFTDPEGSRSGIGSMLIGYYEGNALRFAGKVGTGRGWGDTFGRKLRTQLESMESKTPSFDPPPRGWLGKNAHWVRPRLVAEIEFAEWTGDGKIRHPSLQGFRKDKKPADVVREVAVDVAPPEMPNQIVYPKIDVGIRELVELYSDIAEWALPHVKGRPLTLVRMRAPISKPDALRSQAAFVHHTARDQKFVSDAVPRMSIREKKKTGEYRYVESVESLVALIEAGVVEWHVWNALVDDVERPDRVVFDIDPGDGVPWSRVVAAARRLRAMLRGRDLESWVKTTGGKGLHVVVPFRREHHWDDVFEFARAISEQLAGDDPDQYTTVFDKRQRTGKVLIDYKRNYRTSIAVAGFSLRARPNGAMSVPVKWEGLARLGSGDAFTVANIRDRLRRLRADPWQDYWKAKQRLRL
jgi:bifunctional non-homologous end joining protein LigD